MKIFSFCLSMLRPVRFFISCITCALLFFSNVVPAFAIGSYQSNPTEATDQLLETQKKTDDISTQAPPGAKEEIEATKGGGLNAVQGDADIEKMKRPENSQDAVSVEDEVNNFLGKIKGKK